MSTVSETLRGWAVQEVVADRRAQAGVVLGPRLWAKAITVLYLGGISQLFLLTGQGLGELLVLAVLPFLVGDATKVLPAFLLTGTIRQMSLGRRKPGAFVFL